MKWTTTVYEVVFPFFKKYFKSSIFSFAGGSPPCTPRRSAEGRPIGQEIMQSQWGQFCENQLIIEKKIEKFWKILKFFEILNAPVTLPQYALALMNKKNMKNKFLPPLSHTTAVPRPRYALALLNF